jgi:hypothetical protein
MVTNNNNNNNNNDNHSAKEQNENAISAVVICIHSRTVWVVSVVQDFSTAPQRRKPTHILHTQQRTVLDYVVYVCRLRSRTYRQISFEEKNFSHAKEL